MLFLRKLFRKQMGERIYICISCQRYFVKRQEVVDGYTWKFERRKRQMSVMGEISEKRL